MVFAPVSGRDPGASRTGLWSVDRIGRPLLALLSALARDPLLVSTAAVVAPMVDGDELSRSAMRSTVATAAGERLNESVLDKVVRNAASSWTQSGHLLGRTFKRRRRVQATPHAVAFALWLAHTAGFRGESLLVSGWLATLDCLPPNARTLVFEAKRLGLIDLRMSGNVFELSLDRLDPMAKHF